MSVDRAQIEHLRSFVATPRCMSYETIRSLGDILDNLEAASAEVAALRRQVEEMRASADTVTVPREEWTIAQILANAWGRHPMTCGERDKLVAEWDTLRSGEAGKGVV